MRIGFLLYRSFHEPILRPISDRLRKRHHCLMTSSEADLFAFRPHVVVLAEAIAGRLRQKLPGTLFIHTRHGLASKNAQHTCQGAIQSDYICVTSSSVRDWYLQHNARPRRGFWIVGYSQMDPVFRNEPFQPPVTVPPGNKVVLYAPTWTPALSSAAMLHERTVELLRGGRSDVTLIIKPHPLIAEKTPAWMQSWRAAAAADPQVHLIEDGRDVMPFLRLADLLVTDASSVQLEYLALDRPMILISNPDRIGAPAYEPSGYEWAWRDMGEDVSDVNQLPALIDDALRHPETRQSERARYRQMLFGDLTDGRAAERIADNVHALRHAVPLAQIQGLITLARRRLGSLRRHILGRGHAKVNEQKAPATLLR